MLYNGQAMTCNDKHTISDIDSSRSLAKKSQQLTSLGEPLFQGKFNSFQSFLTFQILVGLQVLELMQGSAFTARSAGGGKSSQSRAKTGPF